jgi:virginiamycin B lyase
MRRLVPIVLILAALCAALLPTAAGARPVGRTTFFSLPKGTSAEALAVGAEGDLWFAGVHHGAGAANVVGRISSSGAVHQYAIPGSGTALGIGGLALGPEGDMWFTEPAANAIGRVAPTGNPEAFTVPTAESRPSGIVTAEGLIWVTLEGVGRLVRLDTNGTATEITLPAGSRPTALAVASDSAVWAIDGEAPTVTRRHEKGFATIYKLPTEGGTFTPLTTNSDIVGGPDDYLWLSQSDGPFVAKVRAEGAGIHYVRYKLPMVREGTFRISTGPAGDIWFAGGTVIGSISTHGLEAGEVACVVAACLGPIKALAKGPEGALWFALGNRVGTFRPPALHVALQKGAPPKKGKTLPIAVECRGGAAGQTCGGRVDLRLRLGPHKFDPRSLGRAGFSIKVLKRRKVVVPLTAHALELLKVKEFLRITAVVKVGGKVVQEHKYLLRGRK